MEFKTGQTVRYIRASGSKCSGTIYKVEGEFVWIRSQCGNIKRHKLQITLK